MTRNLLLVFPFFIFSVAGTITISMDTFPNFLTMQFSLSASNAEEGEIVTLRTIPSDSLNGNLTATAKNNKATFYPLTGKLYNFDIIAKGDKSGDSNQISVKIPLTSNKIVRVVYTPKDIDVDVELTLTIEVTDSLSRPWNSTINIGLDATPDIIRGQTTGVMATGIINMKISFPVYGPKSISVILDGINSYTFSMNIKSLYIQFNKDLSLTSYTSKDYISLGVTVGSALYGISKDYNVTLTLKCESLCSGTYMMQPQELNRIEMVTSFTDSTRWGNVSFQNFRILSGGTFFIVASSPGLVSNTTSHFVVYNSIKFIQAKTNSNQTFTANFPVPMSIKILGDDNELFVFTVVLTILDPSKSLKSDLTPSPQELGSYAYVALFKNSGNKTLTFITDIGSAPNGTLVLEINRNKLIFYDMPLLLPVNTNQWLFFKVRVTDSKGNITEVNNGPYRVILSLNDDDREFYSDQKFKGVNNTLTESGIAEFSQLFIKSPGDFYLNARLSDEQEGDDFETLLHIESTYCGPGAGPVACMSVLVFLGFFVSFVMYKTDEKMTNFPQIKYIILYIHPFIALFIKSPLNRRMLMCFQLFTSELLNLTLIGAVYAYWDSPDQHYERDFSSYYGRILYKGGFGWALAQVVIIPLFFFNFFTISNKNLVRHFLIACATITIMCFAGIVAMTVKYCIGFSNYWTANFLIYLAIDLGVMYVIYMIIAYCIMSQNIAAILKNNIDDDKTRTKKNKNSKHRELQDSPDPKIVDSCEDEDPDS